MLKDSGTSKFAKYSKQKGTSNVIDFATRKPRYIEWPMSKKIKVGINSDGYLILQALQPLFDEGWSLHVTSGESDLIGVQLMKPKGQIHKVAEGTSFSVALRRATIGLSKEFSHMTE